MANREVRPPLKKLRKKTILTMTLPENNPDKILEKTKLGPIYLVDTHITDQVKGKM